jgi:hypothetical protein
MESSIVAMDIIIGSILFVIIGVVALAIVKRVLKCMVGLIILAVVLGIGGGVILYFQP